MMSMQVRNPNECSILWVARWHVDRAAPGTRGTPYIASDGIRPCLDRAAFVTISMLSW